MSPVITFVSPVFARYSFGGPNVSSPLLLITATVFLVLFAVTMSSEPSLFISAKTTEIGDGKSPVVFALPASTSSFVV